MIKVTGKEQGVGTFVVSTLETNPHAVRVDIRLEGKDRELTIYAVNLLEALDVLKNVYGFFRKGMMNV